MMDEYVDFVFITWSCLKVYFLNYKYNQNNAIMESQANQMSGTRCILICYFLKQNSTDGLQIFIIINLAF